MNYYLALALLASTLAFAETPIKDPIFGFVYYSTSGSESAFGSVGTRRDDAEHDNILCLRDLHADLNRFRKLAAVADLCQKYAVANDAALIHAQIFHEPTTCELSAQVYNERSYLPPWSPQISVTYFLRGQKDQLETASNTVIALDFPSALAGNVCKVNDIQFLRLMYRVIDPLYADFVKNKPAWDLESCNWAYGTAHLDLVDHVKTFVENVPSKWMNEDEKKIVGDYPASSPSYAGDFRNKSECDAAITSLHEKTSLLKSAYSRVAAKRD